LFQRLTHWSEDSTSSTTTSTVSSSANSPPGSIKWARLQATDQRTLEERPFPKKIWQSWKDDSEDPTDRTVGFPKQWRTTNPDHRYERITDKNSESYVRDRFSDDIYKLFSQLSDPILRADLLRYLILYADGGVYADIDTHPKQPVSKWIPIEYRDKVNLVVGIENDHKGQRIWPTVPYTVQLAQYVVLAKPGHIVMAKLIERVCDSLRKIIDSATTSQQQEKQQQHQSKPRPRADPKLHLHFDEVMSTTGPFPFTAVLMEYFSNLTREKYTGDQFTSMKGSKLIGDVLVLPLDSFGWMPQLHTVEEDDPIVKVIHLFIGSWRDSHPG
jgi:mannosyltransferase OCH1-like enzyme